MLKIATWNVNSLPVRLAHGVRWIEANRPQLFALQECKVTDDEFPRAEFEALGYHVLSSGERSYNGVALISAGPGTDIMTDLPGFEDPQRRVLGATFNGVRLLNLYVPNGQRLGSAKFAYKLAWLDALAECIESQLLRYEELLVVGDFNIAPDDRDLYDPEILRGSIMTSADERAAFQRLLDLGLKDALRLFDQGDRIFTWWDYRMRAFQGNRGMRIDHILVSPALRARCRACYVDKAPRGWERPSDHAPVVAEFD